MDAIRKDRPFYDEQAEYLANTANAIRPHISGVGLPEKSRIVLLHKGEIVIWYGRDGYGEVKTGTPGDWGAP